MSGRELYALYERGEYVLNNCTVDTWDELTASDRAVWEYMAEVIRGSAR